MAQAVHRFRQETTPRPGAGAGLVAGVYVYATMGFEEIDALGGARHGYPPRTTITIVKAAADGGCAGTR